MPARLGHPLAMLHAQKVDQQAPSPAFIHQNLLFHYPQRTPLTLSSFIYPKPFYNWFFNYSSNIETELVIYRIEFDLQVWRGKFELLA